MSPDQYRDLILRAVPAEQDADTLDPSVETLHTPNNHKDALSLDATIVQGGRGVGKTVWFKTLLNPRLRAIAAHRYGKPEIERATVLAGFGAEISDAYPGPRVLTDLVRRDFDPADIWWAVILHSVRSPELTVFDTWGERVRWVTDHPEEFENALRRADRQAADDRSKVLILFDALDRFSYDRSIVDKLVGALLQVGLEMRTSTGHLRAKIFIRHDMVKSAKVTFVDVSKLITNKVSLHWSNNDLYSLFFHQLASAADDKKRELQLGFTVDDCMDASEEKLNTFLLRMAAPYMGRDYRKGRTYKWIPEHLADGRGEASPRSFLSALREAARDSKERAQSAQERHLGDERALHWDSIRHGVRIASEIRVEEVREDTPWVFEALTMLAGERVPIEEDAVYKIWKSGNLLDKLSVSQPPSASMEFNKKGGSPVDLMFDPDMEMGFYTDRAGPAGTSASSILAELKMLGMVTMRRDGRVDLPDVYRIALGIGRKGGIPLQKRS